MSCIGGKPNAPRRQRQLYLREAISLLRKSSRPPGSRVELKSQFLMRLTEFSFYPQPYEQKLHLQWKELHQLAESLASQQRQLRTLAEQPCLKTPIPAPGRCTTPD